MNVNHIAPKMCIHRLIMGVLFLVGIGISAGPGTAQEPSGELSTILDTWRQRQKSVESFDFIWQGVEYRSKEYAAMDDELPAGDAARRKPADRTFDVRMRYALDRRGRARFEYQGEEWSPEKGVYVAKETTELFDGITNTVFFAKGLRDFPGLHVSKARAARVARDVRRLPLNLAFRPLHPEIGFFDPQQLQVTGRERTGEGAEFVVLQDAFGRIYVDPARDYVPVRYERFSRSHITQQLTIEYRRDEQFGSVPLSWSNTSLTSDDRVLTSVSAEVVQYSINEPIPESEFTINPPVGTWVRNYITNERYILREGGQKRHIRRGEYDGTNYAQLLATDAPPLEKGRGWTIALLIINVLLVAALVAFLVYRWRATSR